MTRRNWIGALALSTTLALGLSAAVAPLPASATACVSKAEYKKIKNGMSKAAVKKLTGTGGKKETSTTLAGSSYEVRSYKMCTAYTWAWLIFVDGLVTNKSRLGP